MRIFYGYSFGRIAWQGFLLLIAAAFSLSGCGTVSEDSITPTVTVSLTPSPTQTSTPTVVWFPSTATPTPALTLTSPPATPDQRVGLGEILFTDDFVSPDQWLLTLSDVGNVQLGKRELTIAVAQAKTYLFSIRTDTRLTDFYAEVTASPTLCRGLDEYGVLVRYMSSRDYYRFSLSCDGQVRLDRVLNGKASSPQPWMWGMLVPLGAPSSSRLGVWAVGKEMRFFVNDQYQFSVSDPTLPAGTLGVFARQAGEDVLTVSFSHLVVKEIIK